MHNDSIFWIEVEKIKPNPYQPRKEFSESRLRELSDSIRQYGILQPLVVTRKEVERQDGGLTTEYELIAGERRLRASKLAGLTQVPVVIRTGSVEESERIKLELAIIENIQREDLSPMDRAHAFKRLAEEFNFTHAEVGKKVGKSREYVSNSIRLLGLPSEIIDALSAGKISEGHARTLLMLVDKPEEQMTLFKDIIYKKLTVREAESLSRHIAHEKVRRKTAEFDPEFLSIEQKLTDHLGTRVHIERREEGGKVMIDFFTTNDLRQLLGYLEEYKGKKESENENTTQEVDTTPSDGNIDEVLKEVAESSEDVLSEEEKEEEELYSVRNFSL